MDKKCVIFFKWLYISSRMLYMSGAGSIYTGEYIFIFIAFSNVGIICRQGARPESRDV